MHVVVTGGSGFLGARLARGLLAAGALDAAGGGVRELSRMTLIDQAPGPADLTADRRVTAIRGDLADLLGPGGAGREAIASADLIFHLAAAVSGECEADFDLGIRANLHGTEALLAACRAAETNPVVVYSSSVAVFGTSQEHPLPPVVQDDTLPNPQTSYGIQKFIGEQLLADYTRKGFLRGRAIRLMTISVRPGRPNAAASGFLSGIIREPLAGLRAVCPVDPDTEVVLAFSGQGDRRPDVRGHVLRSGLGRPHRGESPRAHGVRRGHGRRPGTRGRAGGQGADRLGSRRRRGQDVRHLAGRGPVRPGDAAGPDPRSRHGLAYPHASRRVSAALTWPGTSSRVGIRIRPTLLRVS